MQVTGKITKVLPTEVGTKKDGSGNWVKQLFIVETTEQYNNLYCFEIFGDEKVNNFNKFNKVGDVVDVDFNVSANEWNGKYFTTLQMWKVFKSNAEAPATMEEHTQPQGAEDDLPF